MSNIKKITGAILLLLSSHTLFAGTTATIYKDKPMVDASAWDFGVQALYLRASYSGEYSYLNDTRVSPNVDKKNPVDTDWGWGYQLEGAYHFNLNNDLNLNWYHYSKATEGTFVYQTNPTADHYENRPTWDAVNLEVGQHFKFNEINAVRLYGGVQYAAIKTTYHGKGIDPITGPGSENLSMKYYGVGPRVGADLSINLGNTGASLAAKSAVAMLAGDSEFHYAETFGTSYHSSGSKFVVVPEAELKLEAEYKRNIANGSLGFSFGYMFVNYFNVLHDNFTGTETNLALNGPYFGVQWTS